MPAIRRCLEFECRASQVHEANRANRSPMTPAIAYRDWVGLPDFEFGSRVVTLAANRRS